jgi:hypothetical protein
MTEFIVEVREEISSAVTNVNKNLGEQERLHFLNKLTHSYRFLAQKDELSCQQCAVRFMNIFLPPASISPICIFLPGTRANKKEKKVKDAALSSNPPGEYPRLRIIILVSIYSPFYTDIVACRSGV